MIVDYLKSKLAEKEAILADFDAKVAKVEELTLALDIAKGELDECGDLTNEIAERDEIKSYIAEFEKPEVVEATVEEVAIESEPVAEVVAEVEAEPVAEVVEEPVSMESPLIV